VRHGHFLVKARKSHPVVFDEAGRLVTVLDAAEEHAIEHAMEEVKGRGIPDWLSFDANSIRDHHVDRRRADNLPVQEQLM